MKKLLTLSATTLTLILALTANTYAAALQAILLTSPGVYHDYAYQTQAISASLAARMHIQVDVSLAEKERWKTTDFGKGYDVIIYNFCMADNTDPALIANMRRQTEVLGIPAVVVHCTMHSFRKTDLWWPLYGLQSNAHESIGTMPQRHATEHPVLTGIPKDWVVAHDELYINVAFDALPLLTSTGEDGQDHVTAWTQSANGTRIFGTTLGHSEETIQDPVYQQLLANGLLWVADRLRPDGTASEGLAPDSGSAVIGEISKAKDVDFLGDEARSCMQGEIFWSVGPCYAGCTLNPLLWGEESSACKAACVANIPASEVLIDACRDADTEH